MDSDEEDVLYSSGVDQHASQTTLLGEQTKNLDDIMYPTKGRMKKTIGLFLAFIGLGLSVAVVGPTLPGLRDQLGLPAADRSVTYIFPGRGIGYLIGTFLAGVCYDCFYPMVLIAASLMLSSLAMAVTATTFDLQVDVLMSSAVGLTMATLHAGSDVILSKLWGKRAAEYMRLALVAFAVGAFISPLLVTCISRTHPECTPLVTKAISLQNYSTTETSTEGQSVEDEPGKNSSPDKPLRSRRDDYADCKSKRPAKLSFQNQTLEAFVKSGQFLLPLCNASSNTCVITNNTVLNTVNGFIAQNANMTGNYTLLTDPEALLRVMSGINDCLPMLDHPNTDESPYNFISCRNQSEEVSQNITNAAGSIARDSSDNVTKSLVRGLELVAGRIDFYTSIFGVVAEAKYTPSVNGSVSDENIVEGLREVNDALRMILQDLKDINMARRGNGDELNKTANNIDTNAISSLTMIVSNLTTNLELLGNNLQPVPVSYYENIRDRLTETISDLRNMSSSLHIIAEVIGIVDSLSPAPTTTHPNMTTQPPTTSATPSVSATPRPREANRTIHTVYLIISVYLGVMSLVFFFFTYISPITSDTVNQRQTTTNWNPFQIKVLAVVFCFHVLYRGAEVSLGGYISEYFYQKFGKMPQCHANFAAPMFWGGFVVGRVMYIHLFASFSKVGIVVMDLIGSMVASLVVVYSSEYVAYSGLVLVSIGFLGMSVASLQSAGVAWLRGFVDLDGKAAPVIALGSVAGEAIVPMILAFFIYPTDGDGSDERSGMQVLIYGVCIIIAVISAMFCYIHLNAEDTDDNRTAPSNTETKTTGNFVADVMTDISNAIKAEDATQRKELTQTKTGQIGPKLIKRHKE